MDPYKVAEEQKLLIEKTYSQAQAYTNLIMLAGYASIFVLWTNSKGSVSPLIYFSSGILFAVSLAVFVGWELYGMHVRAKGLFAIARSVDDPERFVSGILDYQREEANRAFRLARIYRPVFVIATVTGFSSLILISIGFCIGLYKEFNWVVGPEEMVVLQVIGSIAAGSFLACSVAFAFIWYVQSKSARDSLRNLAQSLADEMRSSSGLYLNLRQEWETKGFVSHALLNEMVESRVDFQNARPHLPLIPDQDIRQKISAYYRRTAIDIDSIRQMENDRSRAEALIERGPAELARAKDQNQKDEMSALLMAKQGELDELKDAIREKLDKFDAHRAMANHISEKLERFFS